jgi:hypothetical protein
MYFVLYDHFQAGKIFGLNYGESSSFRQEAAEKVALLS